MNPIKLNSNQSTLSDFSSIFSPNFYRLIIIWFKFWTSIGCKKFRGKKDGNLDNVDIWINLFEIKLPLLLSVGRQYQSFSAKTINKSYFYAPFGKKCFIMWKKFIQCLFYNIHPMTISSNFIAICKKNLQILGWRFNSFPAKTIKKSYF